MPLSEEDIYRKEIDDAVADIKQQIQTSKAHGTSPRLPDYNDLFGKIVKSAARDPRMSPRTVENITDHAKKKYQSLATHAGLKGDVMMEPHVIRGLQVHVAVMVEGAELQVQTFADERHAANAVDQFLSSREVNVTAYAISIYKNAKQLEGHEPPLYGTKYHGTRVETCTIN